MSYIRAGSNPEGLYIWGDVSGDAIIAQGQGPWRTMPNEIWDALLEAWAINCYEDVALIRVLDGEVHEVSLTLNKERKFCINYKDDQGSSWTLDNIWPVTMHYIASDATNPYYGASWFKRKLLGWLGA
ncbi:MAG: hypothetical protein KAV87_13150 [Desulfobacteraceae bacterium]|nr:hypothetical protein [Desulfobacteraceae bacterium]